MFYENKAAEVVKEGKWDEKSCVRRVGGYDLDKTNLPAGMKYLPKGAVLEFDASTGKTKLVKSAVVAEDALKDATTLKVNKGHNLIVGDKVEGSAISAISIGEESDTLTVAALGAAVDEGDVVASVGDDTIILGLNYATIKIDDFPSCTPTLQAYEIEEDTLPYPINDAIKTALTVRHAFKV